MWMKLGCLHFIWVVVILIWLSSWFTFCDCVSRGSWRKNTSVTKVIVPLKVLCLALCLLPSAKRAYSFLLLESMYPRAFHVWRGVGSKPLSLRGWNQHLMRSLNTLSDITKSWFNPRFTASCQNSSGFTFPGWTDVLMDSLEKEKGSIGLEV